MEARDEPVETIIEVTIIVSSSGFNKCHTMTLFFTFASSYLTSKLFLSGHVPRQRLCFYLAYPLLCKHFSSSMKQSERHESQVSWYLTNSNRAGWRSSGDN